MSYASNKSVIPSPSSKLKMKSSTLIGGSKATRASKFWSSVCVRFNCSVSGKMSWSIRSADLAAPPTDTERHNSCKDHVKHIVIYITCVHSRTYLIGVWRHSPEHCTQTKWGWARWVVGETKQVRNKSFAKVLWLGLVPPAVLACTVQSITRIALRDS